MPFENLLSANDIADIRQATGDVLAGTFGLRDVTLVRKVSLGRVDYGSEQTTDQPLVLKALVLDKKGTVREMPEVSDLEFKLALLFHQDYLVEQGVAMLAGELDEVNARRYTWQLDGRTYRVIEGTGIMQDAQLADTPVLVWVFLQEVHSGD